MTDEEITAEIENRKKAYYDKIDKQYMINHPPVTVDVDKTKK